MISEEVVVLPVHTVKTGLVICTDRELLFHAVERMMQGIYLCELVPVGTLKTWLHRLQAMMPNCLVLDSEAQMSELIRQVQERFQGLPVVVWQRANATEASLHALELGALGVLHDSSTVADVTVCLKTVQEGHVWVPQSVAQASLDFRRYRLSPREWQVMKLVSQGLCNKEIAWAMGITEGTTKVYLSRMFDKLEVSDRYELALLGLRHFAQSNSPDVGAAAKLHRTAAGICEHPQSVFVYRPPVRATAIADRV